MFKDSVTSCHKILAFQKSQEDGTGEYGENFNRMDSNLYFLIAKEFQFETLQREI